MNYYQFQKTVLILYAAGAALYLSWVLFNVYVLKARQTWAEVSREVSRLKQSYPIPCLSIPCFIFTFIVANTVVVLVFTMLWPHYAHQEWKSRKCIRTR